MSTSVSVLGTIEESGLSDTHFSSSNVSPNNEELVDSHEEDSDDEQFIYPGQGADLDGHPTQAGSSSAAPQPSPAQLEALYAAASSGDLPLLKKLFQNSAQAGPVQPFALANDASPRTGLTALHAAASRGYIDIVKWLIEECGAMPDLEDKEGETALHKAALNGHLDVLTYLLPNRADVHARDADGWTALHNACSKGYLDIVRWLCESGGAASEYHGTPGVDIRSKGGWTPLMNAASKGHLPTVRYLLTKQAADPLVRNNWGETAYDAAAAVFEIWICEVLQKYEALKWRRTTTAYNPLAVHTTVPLILYENQRLDTRLKTLAVSGGRPKFSASGLGKHGRHAPFELKLPKPDEETRETTVAAFRSDVQLPLRNDHLTLPKPTDRRSLEGAERSHFWLSDWTLDVSHPHVDVEEGWQYARTFDDPEDQWTAEQPPQLQRLLTGTGVMSGLSSPAGSSSFSPSQNWVRRRRWVRVMRRRLDIPPLPFLEPDGALYHLGEGGSLILYIPESRSGVDAGSGDNDGQELGSMPSTLISTAQDYVARARYLSGNQVRDTDSLSSVSRALSVRRAIAKLERATTELRQGILSDEDADRKARAEVLLETYSQDLKRKRLAAGARGWLISEDDDLAPIDGGEEDSSDEEFHYPGSSPVEPSRPTSIMSNMANAPDHFQTQSSSSSRVLTDLTPQLSQAPDFRVPTHEAPQKVSTRRWTPPTPHSMHAHWERDETVSQCRECGRRFGFLLRRHCRKCGRIFCDACSFQRALLDPSDVIQDPASPAGPSAASSHRVCRSCFDQVDATVPNELRAARTNSLERIVVQQGRLTVTASAQTSSQLSDLADCPVCNRRLEEVGDAAAQEAHVRDCLEGGEDTSTQVAKYLVYKLPDESALIGIECVICLEEFMRGSEVARLSCLCSFHNVCLSSWLQRGKSCPVHAR